MSLLTVTDCVDPHHHLWTTKTHSWLEGVAESGHPAGPFKSVQNYEVEDFVRDCSSFNVKKSVHVQAHFDGDPVAETKYCQEVADKHGFPHGIVAYADLADSNVGTLLERHCGYANMRGIRQMLDYHPVVEQWRQAPHDRLLSEDSWLTGLKLMERHNLSFDLQIHVPQMQAAAAVVRSHPNIQFILNHGGFPAELSAQAITSWKEGLTMLAQHDNVTVKLSGFNQFHNVWSKELFYPLVEFPINVFSTNRCMFASNFPVDKINGGYRELMECYASICTDMGLSQEDADKMFRDNATRVYRI